MYIYIYIYIYIYKPADAAVKKQCIKEMLAELHSALSSIISLFEIRGHCIAGRDLVSIFMISFIIIISLPISGFRLVLSRERGQY